MYFYEAKVRYEKQTGEDNPKKPDAQQSLFT